MSNYANGAGLPGCDLVYGPKPDGPSGEYAPIALNLYRGCGHKCRYCYVPPVVKMSRADFDKGAVLKVD